MIVFLKRIRVLKNKFFIDTKFYSKTLEVNEFGKKRINEKNLRQINAYLDNAKVDKDQKLNGMLLHPTIDKEYDESFTYRKKFKVYFRTINLNKDWKTIRNSLSKIIEPFYGEN